MCNPAALAAVGMTVGGSLINRSQQNSAIEAQNRLNREAMERSRQAREAEYARQDQWESEQRGGIMDVLPKVDPAARAAKATERAEDNPVARAAASLAPLVTGTDRVGKEVAKDINTATQRARKQIEAMALARALGGGDAAGRRAFAGVGQDVADLALIRRNSARVADEEALIPPATARPNDSPVGDLMIAAGQGVGMYGGQLSGAGNPTIAPRKPLRPGSLY